MPGAGGRVAEMSHTRMRSSELSSADGLAAELTRRHAILRAGLADAGGDALVATREGAVTYLTGYTTATWSNHSRPIVAVLTPSTLDVVCAETEADAVRSRVPGVTVHPYVELRSPDGLSGLPDGAIQFTPHACEVLTTVLGERDARTIGVDALGAVHPPTSRIVDLLPARIGRFDASKHVWAARLRKSAWEIERMRAACDILDRAFADLHAALRPGMSERDIHNILAAASFAHGAHRLGYTMVVAGVERGLFGDPTERRWQKGEVLFVDGGVVRRRVLGRLLSHVHRRRSHAVPARRLRSRRPCSRCRTGARCCPHREQSWSRDRFGAGPASRPRRVRSFWSRHRTLHAGATVAPPG